MRDHGAVDPTLGEGATAQGGWTICEACAFVWVEETMEGAWMEATPVPSAGRGHHGLLSHVQAVALSRAAERHHNSPTCPKHAQGANSSWELIFAINICIY